MKKKIMLMMLSLMAIIVLCFSSCIVAHASGDTTKPVINWAKVVTPKVTKPGILYVDVNITEEGLGTKRIKVSIGPYDEWVSTYSAEDTKTHFTGTVRVEVPIPSTAKSTQYEVKRIDIIDQANNENNVSVSLLFEYGYDDGGYRVEKGGDYYFVLEDVDRIGSDWDIKKTPHLDRLTFDVYDEFNTSFETSLTNPKLQTNVDALKDGEYGKIYVDKSSDGIVKASIFKSIQGKNRNLVIYDDYCQWIIKGKSVTNPKDINVKTTFASVSGDTFSNTKNIVKVDFKNNGTLPGKTRIRMKSDYLYSLKNIKGTLKLYHLSDDGYTVEEEKNPNFDLTFDGTDKWCCFDITHNSSFLISSGALKDKKKAIVVGSVVNDNAGTIKVISTKSKTVAFTKAKNSVNVSVPATVKIEGKSYKVTQINEGAFKGSKIRKVTIGKNIQVIKKNAFKGSKATKVIVKTKLLKKAKVKNALKGSKVKTVQVKVGNKKQNKKYVKTYKKFFTKKNAGKKVTVK